jgi:hydroxymethylpyrimidine pyrophosphatase-like HAD family hydrolase
MRGFVDRRRRIRAEDDSNLWSATLTQFSFYSSYEAYGEQHARKNLYIAFLMSQYAAVSALLTSPQPRNRRETSSSRIGSIAIAWQAACLLFILISMIRDANSLSFVMDCDNTIVHYTSASIDVDESDGNELIALPASASGMRGFLHPTNSMLIQEISRSVDVICCSGMRMSTMLSRYQYFPMIKYWICENGGRIFHWKRESEGLIEVDYGLVEDADWLEYSRRPEDLEALDRFAEELRSRDCLVDRQGYASMIRIKGKALEQLIAMVPASLKYTFNLGHLDVFLPRSGKQAAIQWLLAKIHPEDPRYLFMGDDDNDIEAAAQAEIAFICMPCSSAMRRWIEEEASKRPERRVVIPNASLQHHAATTSLLRSVLDSLTPHQQPS